MRNSIKSLLLVTAMGMTLSLASMPMAEVIDRVAAEAIGEEVEGSTAIALSNLTGKDIKGIQLSVNGSDFSDNALAKDTVFGDKEDRTWNVVLEAAEEAEKVEATEEEASDEAEEDAAPTQYDIKLTFADDTECVLHAVPLTEMEYLHIRLAGKIAFVQFKSTVDGKYYETLEAEQALAPKEEVVNYEPATYDDGNSYVSYTPDETYYYEEDSYDYDYEYDEPDYSDDGSSYGSSDGGSYGPTDGGDIDPNELDFGETDNPDEGGENCLDDGISLN